MMDGPLLALGNIQLISGILLYTGLNNFMKTFISLKRIPFTILFFLGFALVLLRYPLIGIIMEIISIFYLFQSIIENWWNKLKFFIPFLTLKKRIKS